MKFEELKPDLRVRGIDPAGQVKILHVEFLRPDAAAVTYSRAKGDLGRDTLFRSNEPKLEDVKTSLKLAVGAPRIELTHLFDPMMAVHIADMDPLRRHLELG